MVMMLLLQGISHSSSSSSSPIVDTSAAAALQASAVLSTWHHGRVYAQQQTMGPGRKQVVDPLLLALAADLPEATVKNLLAALLL